MYVLFNIVLDIKIELDGNVVVCIVFGWYLVIVKLFVY